MELEDWGLVHVWALQEWLEPMEKEHLSRKWSALVKTALYCTTAQVWELAQYFTF